MIQEAIGDDSSFASIFEENLALVARHQKRTRAEGNASTGVSLHCTVCTVTLLCKKSSCSMLRL